MSVSSTLASAWDALKAKAEAIWTDVKDGAEDAGSAILSGLGALVENAEPTLVNGVKAILAGLPADFLSGATLDDIAEQVIAQAEADLKGLLTALEPQALATLIGVLIKAL